MRFRSQLVILAMAVSAVACHDESDVRVSRLTFHGNKAITTTELQTAMATKSGGRLPWSPKVPFDRAVFERDLARLPKFYEDRGYPHARVRDVAVDLNQQEDAVTIAITIDEGQPLLVHAVRITGLDALPEPVRAQLARTAPVVGKPRDRRQVAALRQQTIDLLHNNGYAYGTASVEETTSPEGVDISVAATAGSATVFGPITIVGQDHLSDRVILRHVGLQPGQTYRLLRATQGQQRLASLEILQFAHVDARPAGADGPAAVPITVTVAEVPRRRLDLGVGYGTEDRVRGSIKWSHLNFRGNANRLSTEAKWSSIDRGFRLSLVDPYVLRRGLSLEATGSTWWTSEPIYTSATYGGQVALRYRVGTRQARPTRSRSDSIRLAYVHEFVRSTIRPESLDDLSNIGTRIALGLDPITGTDRGTRVALELDYDHLAVDNAVDPRKGYGVSTHLEQAFRVFHGSYDYREVLAQGHVYVPMGRVVLASRVRAGTIAAQRDADVPFSARYYLGGSTSLRGWGRYEVAPLSDGIPVGGRTILDATAEARVPVRGPLGAVVFADVGNVWSRSFATLTLGLRTDVGAGVRYKTPVGLIRADVGVQLNPVEGLLVQGMPESRHWRIHVSIGQAF